MLNPDEELQYASQVRKQVIGAITNIGLDRVVIDSEMTANLLKALKDIDSVALTQMRIKAESENNDKANSAKITAAEILATLNPNDAKNMYSVNHAKRSFDDSDGGRDYVQDEVFVGVSSQTVDDLTHE